MAKITKARKLDKMMTILIHDRGVYKICAFNLPSELHEKSNKRMPYANTKRSVKFIFLAYSPETKA
jgi:hypothetical protein